MRFTAHNPSWHLQRCVVCNRFIADLLYCSFPSISSEEHAHVSIPSHIPRERDSNVYVLRHSGPSLIRHSQRTIFSQFFFCSQIVRRVVDHWVRTHHISMLFSCQDDFQRKNGGTVLHERVSTKSFGFFLYCGHMITTLMYVYCLPGFSLATDNF